MEKLRLGTRGSALALCQARQVRDMLVLRRPGLEITIQVIRTRGDADRAASPAGGPGAFTGAIERALLEGRVDLAVHSLKDLPTAASSGLIVAAFPPREDPADALVSRRGESVDALRRGAAVLTGSPRRRAQLLHLRPDLRVLPVRGNVETRLRKVDEGAAEGVLLACAGLRRLGLEGRISQRFDPGVFLPACGQGALAVQIRSADVALAELCGEIDDMPTRLAVTAERSFLSALGGGCRVPAGAFGRFERAASELLLTAMVAARDGAWLVREEEKARVREAHEAAVLGERLAARIRARIEREGKATDAAGS